MSYHAEFLKWNNPPSIIGTVHYHFYVYQDENLKLASQQYRARPDCTDVRTNLALYCWQRLITFGVGRIRDNLYKCLYISERSMEILFDGGKGEIFSESMNWLDSNEQHLQLSGALAVGNFARSGKHL